ncbi:MAG: NAD(P)H-binding protein [Deltaproteobacteria bacterium]|nr:NAD(P)H-binding protein [Deltaproteobacteria bacterium]
MKIAILGATGKTGGHATKHALAQGHTVRALARDPSKLSEKDPLLEVIQGDATNVADCARLVEGCDAVFAAVGPQGMGTTTVRQDIARAVTAAMKQAGVKKLVWLSAFGVGENLAQARRTSWFATLFMKTLLKKTYVDAAAAEAVLRASGLDVVLARPPRLTDGPSSRALVAIPESDKVPRLTCTREDVAKWMLDAAATTSFDRQAVTIC